MRQPLRAINSALRNWGVYAGALASLMAVVAAYQVRPAYDIQFGSATDGPLLRGFHAPEKTPGDNPTSFRWTTEEGRIILRDIGRQELDTVITLAGSRPAGQPASPVAVAAGDAVLLTEVPAPGFSDYKFRVPREAVQDGTLTLRITADPFSPLGDARRLGVIVSRLRVAPTSSPDRFVEPPPGPVWAVLGAAALMGLVLALLGWGHGGALIGSSLVGLLAGALLAFDRLWLTSGRWHEAWPQAIIAASIFTGLAGLLSKGLARWLQLRPGRLQHQILLTILFSAFAVRFAGQLHPQIFIMDLIFHQHRLETVLRGDLLFTIASAEWGGRETFYLPTTYLFILPLQWLLNDQLLAIRLFTVGVGTLGALLLHHLALKVTASGAAGLLAAGLYLAVPIAVLPYSWGITTNLFGEFFALCAFSLGVLWLPRVGPGQLPFWLLAGSLLVALLSHPGVVQLTSVGFGVAMLLVVVRAGGRLRRRALWAFGALALAALAAYLVYYSHFLGGMLTTLAEIREERAASRPVGSLHLLVGGSVADRSLGLVVGYADSFGEWLWGGLVGFWREAWAYYRVWPIVACGLGLWLIAPRHTARSGERQESRRRLLLLSLGWLAAVLIYAVVGWTMNLYVRYALFALPVIALGSALLLAALARRGRGGRALAALVVSLLVVESILLWHYRITYAFK